MEIDYFLYIYNAVVARGIPDDPDPSEMIFAAQVKDFVDDLRRGLIGRVLRNGLGVDQSGVTTLP